VPALTSLFLICFATLVLAPSNLRVAALPPPASIFLNSSPFSNRIQAEANAVQLTCHLLLSPRASARRIAAVIRTDISGSLAHSLRQFCPAGSFKTGDSPDANVPTLSFGSRTALRTSLMLQRINHLQPSAQQPKALPVGDCCQPSSDLDELSFPPLCCEESHGHASVSFALKHERHLTHNHSAGGFVGRFLHCRASTGFAPSFARYGPPHHSSILAAFCRALCCCCHSRIQRCRHARAPR